MPFYPFADITQHGRTLMVSSLSQAQGGHHNEWFRILPLDADDATLVDAVMGALQRSRVEDWRTLPQASAPGNTVDSERLGFTSTRQMEASTTRVAVTLVDGEVFAAPLTTTPGRGYTGGDELPPARGVEQVAQRVREALAEAARRSARVVDHDAIAAAQDAGPDGAGAGGSAEVADATGSAVRSRFAGVDHLAQVVLTRLGERWVVEATSATAGSPPSIQPNGWTRGCARDSDLPAVIAEGLLHAEKSPALPQPESIRLLLDALGASPGTAPADLVRISLEARHDPDELVIWPQELDDDGWWQDPENAEVRVISVSDPVSTWVLTITALAHDMQTAAR